MFPTHVKWKIASEVQRILRETGDPELPDGEIRFELHVYGRTGMSWADIRNNGDVSPKVIPERQDLPEAVAPHRGTPATPHRQEDAELKKNG